MARIPRPLAGEPQVSLTAVELELIDLIDGVRDETELARLVGAAVEDVAEQLERLAMLGVIALESASARSDVGELEAGARHHIDRLYAVLSEADHYELLCLGRDADKRAIKSAYYRLGPAFHPDRHFRKNIGIYKQKIESIFAALTRAHDTLRYPKRREDYDAKVPAPLPGARERREIIAAAVAYLAPQERRSSPGSPPAGMSSPPPRPSQPDAWSAPTLPPQASPPPPRARMESHPSITPMPRSAPVQAGPAQSELPPARPRQASEPSITLPPMRARQESRPSVEPPASDAPPRRQSFPGIPATHLGPEPRVEGRYHSSRPPPRTSPPRGIEVPPPRAPFKSDPGPSAPPPPAHTPLMPPPPEVSAERRDALARKLSARTGPALPPQQPPVEPRTRKRPEGTFQPAAEVRRSAAEVVRDRFDSVAGEMRKRRLMRYLEQARVAMAAGDYRAAAAAYEQASKIDPDDRDIAAKAAEATRRALDRT